ncbi:MAG: hypothetical protein K2Q01_02495, partial [Rickettsiales bacterium]|nr:hypothetical protein [Rickettsiales bacterium]
ITPTQTQSDAIAQYKKPLPVSAPEIYQAVTNIAPLAEIDWRAVDKTIEKRSGIPTAIGKKQ